ncbi:MAG TPA: putative LPS assembly protein LptD [Flavisolibacter sp.]|nr:putative LPS assembly protein LptD [Flavisolibacter sp.]
MRKFFCFVFASLSFCIAITWKSEARRTSPVEIYSTLTTDTIPRTQKDSILRADSIATDTLPTANKDSVVTDTLYNRTDTLPPVPQVDTFSIKLSKDTLDAPVDYEAQDSAVLLVKDKMFLLYGATKTTYKDVTLTAPRVVIDQQTQIVTAYNSRDSLGNVITRARFQQGTEQNFESDTITYNFKTQRGLTKNTYTKQDEMWVQADLIKKVDANTTFARHVIMTTCNFDEPHFGFVSSKGKFINKKVAITGPIHPEFEGVPIPIYLPFGIFPLNPGRHSGILAPEFTVTEQFGIGLTNGGYYHVLNDYLDVKVLGDIYSYGGWRLNLNPTYRKRYKYSGSFNVSLQHTKLNFKGDPDYSLTKTFNVSWNHSMDSRAKPGTNFGASVNLGSMKYNQYVPNNPRRNISNNQASSINYSRTWSGTTPINLTLSANQSQNSNSGVMNITLPDAGFNIATFYPFQRKEVTGTPKWYEKIGVGYQVSARNQVSFVDTLIKSFGSVLDTMQWGAQHRFPINLSLPPLGKFIASPSISYEETWLPQRIRRRWNGADNKIDTISIEKGLFTDRRLSFGVGVNTTIYGKVQFKNAKLSAIRHVVRPTISFNYQPNLSKNKFDLIQIDSTGKRFNPFSQFDINQIYRGYGYGKFGGMSFGIDNNLEAKWKGKKDSIPRTIRLIDGFGFQSAYNFLQDSLKLQPFNLYLRSTLFEKISITAQGVLDPYQVDTLGRRIDRFIFQGDRLSLGRINSGSISMSTQFQSKPRDPKQAPNPNSELNRGISDPTLLQDRQLLEDYMRRNPAEFVDFNIPWSLNISFSLNFSKTYRVEKKAFETNINSSFSFNNSFSLTPKWNFSTTGFYDFDTKKLTQFTMSISRDMHCWQMSINVTPIGDYRYFNITISPKSSILQDLKVNRTRTFVNF